MEKDIQDIIKIPAGMVRLEVAQEDGPSRLIYTNSGNILRALDRYFPRKIHVMDEREELDNP